MNDCLSVAVLMSCYNRKERTLKCVESILSASRGESSLRLTFYVWDDGSDDGTAEALKKMSDNIMVFKGSGNYYWSKSMNEVMKKAVQDDHDLYLMVNDDVLFYADSIETLISDYLKSGGRCAIVGSMRYDGIFTYGGRDRYYNDIEPSGKLMKCRYANWNCFMIDRAVVQKVGLICGKYEHAGGDFDYSCRMNRMGMDQYVASKYVGECEIDHAIPSYYNADKRLLERLHLLFAPKGLPIRSFFRFHWVDKRLKGIVIAAYSYFLVLTKVIFISVWKR